MRTMLKKGICILIMIFSLFGIVNAVYEYSCGFEEIPATVTKVYVARFSHKGRVSEKYVLEWTSKDGEKIQQGNLFNKYGYSVGDEITIRVDARTHQTIYGNYIPYIIVFLVLFIISGFVGFKQGKREK